MQRGSLYVVEIKDRSADSPGVTVNAIDTPYPLMWKHSRAEETTIIVG